MDVKGLMLTNLGHVVLNSTDNIIISSFVGLSWVGLLSNFTLVVDSVTGVLCQITSALSASIGNYFAEKDRKDGYALFQKIVFMNLWLYGFSAICLMTLLNPFIELWLGAKFTLSMTIVYALTANFFVQGYMNTLWTFRSTLGLFTQGWFRPVVVALINIILSILLSFRWGVFGVIIATSIARASVNLWYDPWIIHKYGFQRSVKPFFKMCLIRILQVVSIYIPCMMIKYAIFQNGVTIIRFAVLIVISVGIGAIMFYFFCHRCEEYHFFCNLFIQRILQPLSRSILRRNEKR